MWVNIAHQFHTIQLLHTFKIHLPTVTHSTRIYFFFMIRNCATINLYRSMSGTVKSFEFYPICKQTSWSAIVSWILADLSEANNFITASRLRISIFVPIPLASQFAWEQPIEAQMKTMHSHLHHSWRILSIGNLNFL